MRKILLAGVAALSIMASAQAIAGDHDAGHGTDAATTEAMTTETKAGMDAAPAGETAATGTVVAVASGNPDFSTLVTAIQAAGLADALNGEGPFTVFAPNNAAFAALPEGALADLLKPENKDKLAGVLKYHVVSGKVMAADVKPGEVATLEGATLEIKTDEAGAVMVDGAKVIATDVAADNGVIHVIDAVIMP